MSGRSTVVTGYGIPTTTWIGRSSTGSPVPLDPAPAPGPDPAQLRQVLLPTDKRNPSFPLYRMIDKAYAWKL